MYSACVDNCCSNCASGPSAAVVVGLAFVVLVLSAVPCCPYPARASAFCTDTNTSVAAAPHTYYAHQLLLNMYEPALRATASVGERVPVCVHTYTYVCAYTYYVYADTYFTCARSG